MDFYHLQQMYVVEIGGIFNWTCAGSVLHALFPASAGRGKCLLHKYFLGMCVLKPSYKLLQVFQY